MSWNVWRRAGFRFVSGRKPAARPAGWAGVRLATEWLEDRALPRPTLYVDFGDGFQGGVLKDTVGGLVSARSGSNPAVNGPDMTLLGYSSTDPIELRSFNAAVGANAAAARATIMTLLRRYYEPTNIEVVELTNTPTKLSTGQTVQAPSTLAGVSAILGANNTTQRRNDTYNFVTYNLIGGDDLLAAGLLGISNGSDIGNFNRTEGATLSFAGQGVTGANPSAVDLAITLAHEAGHSFGLQHAYYTAGPQISDPEGQDARLLQRSELMSYLTPIQFAGELFAASAFFSRFPTIKGDGNNDYNTLEGANGTVGPIAQFFADPDVGRNPNIEYVTGTGANDTISVSVTGPNQATVVVTPYQNPDYTGPIAVPGSFGKSNSYSYTIGLSKPIIIDAGLGVDRITLDARLGTAVTVRGQGDDTADSLVIDGDGTGAAVYTPGLNTAPFFDDSPDFQGQVAIGPTVINFSEFDPGSELALRNLASVTVASPAGRDTLAITSTGPNQARVSGKVGGTVPIVPATLVGVNRIGFSTGAGDTPTDNDLLTIDLAGGNPIPAGGLAFDGGAGPDKLTVAADVNFTLSAAKLDIGTLGFVTLANVETADLTGGPAANTFTITDWAGAVQIAGDAKDVIRVVKDADLTLTSTKTGGLVTGSDGLQITFNKEITRVDLTGGPGPNRFTVTAWGGVTTLDGRGGGDTYVLDLASPGVQVSESGTDAAIDTLELTGTAAADAITVTRAAVQIGTKSVALGGAIEAVSVDGADGNDTFTVDVTGGWFAGGTLRFTGGSGLNTLTLLGTPGAPVAQGSVVFTSPTAGTLVFDPDGSSGMLQAGPPGGDATVVPFDGFSSVVNTIPVGRFDVPFTASDDAITIAPGAAAAGLPETVEVTAGAQGIRLGRVAVLGVHGGVGADRFTVNLPAATAGLTSLALYGFQAPGAGPDPDDGAADVFELRASAVPVTLAGQGGDDAFTVGAPRGVAGGSDAITGPVTIDGGAGANTLTLSDFGSAVGNPDVRITAAGVSGLVGKGGTVGVTYTGITGLVVVGSNADAPESFVIDGITLPLDLVTGAGPDSVTARNVSVPLAIDTGAGDDTLVVEAAAFAAATTLKVGEGSNTVRLVGVAAPAGLGVLAGTGNDTITAAGVSGPLTVTAGSGDDSVNVQAADAPVRVVAGEGNNTIRVSGRVGGAGLTVTAGAGNDVVALTALAGPVALDAGGGANDLTLSGVAVAVALAVTTADGDDAILLTGISGAGAVTVAAGAGNDRITAEAVGGATLDAGDGNDTITVAAAQGQVVVLAGAGDDEIVLGGPTVDSIAVPPAIDGGAGTDRVTLNDSGNALGSAYVVSADGVGRDGRPPLSFAGVEGYGLTGGAGPNTYTILGAPAGGVVVTDGPGAGTFLISAAAVAGTSAFTGGGGDDTFMVTAGQGGAPFAIAGGDGRDVVTVVGLPGDDAVAYRLAAPGAGTVLGLGANVSLAAAEQVVIDGAGGTNTLALLDASDTAYGTALQPGLGVVVRPTGAGAGELLVGQGAVAALRYTGFGGGLSVNGDADGSGDADVVTVLGFSTDGLGAGGPLADATTADGIDRVTVTDRRVEITNRAVGPALVLTLDEAAGRPTVQTLLVRTGNEAVPGEEVIVTPSNRVNLVIDAMGPSGPGRTGDRLTVATRGPRTVEAVAADAATGPAHTRMTFDDTGASIGYVGFEAAPRAVNRPRPDGVPILAVASGPGTPAVVRVFEPVSGELLYELRPYADSFLGGVSVATADVTGDGVTDVIVGAGPGGGPHVQVFDGATGAVVQSFFAYEPTFTGGVQVAAGDVDADGVADVILGTGIGGGPRVQAISGRTGAVLHNFFAYEDSFRNGVQVAAGDVNGDGVADVLTGSGFGGGPRVRAFDGLDGAPLYDFFAYDDSFRYGVNVAAGDLDADGYDDLVTGPGSTGVPNVKAFSGATGQVLASIFLDGVTDPANPQPGVRVATADLDGDRVRDIVAGQATGGRPVIRGFKLVGPGQGPDGGPLEVQQVREQGVFDDGFGFGVFVG